MKNIALSFIILLLLGCSNQNNTAVETPDLAAKQDVPVAEKHLNDYQIVYQYRDSSENLHQILGVDWLTNDSIQFLLISNNELCDYKQAGIAVNKHPDMDPEIDEDSDGLSYPVEEFTVLEKGHLNSIRIELGEKSLAKIRYNYSEPRDECDPETEITMKVSS